MKDQYKTKQILIQELASLRQRLAGLEQSESERNRAEEALHKSEEKYRLIFDYSPIGLLSFDGKGVIVTCNDNFVKIIGSSREKLIGLNMLNLPDKNIVSAVQKALNGSQGFYEGVYFSVTAKKNTPVRCLFAPMNVGGKDIQDGVGIIEDITERKQMEESLKETELKFRTIFDYASDGILLAQIGDRKFSMANNTICKMLGYSQEELLKFGVSDIHPEESLPYVNEQFQKLLDKEILVAQNIPILKKDKTVSFVDISASVISLQEEDYLVGMFRDITERKKAEDALKESEEKFRLLSDQSLLAIGLLQKGLFKYVNQAFCDISGYTSDEIMTWQPYEFLKVVVHPDDKDLVMAPVDKEQTYAVDVARRFEFRGLTKNGKTIWLDLYLKAVLYQGRYADLLSFVDITERKRAEEELQQSEEKFRILMESSPIAILLYQNNKWVYANHATTEITGYTEQELRGMNFWDIVHPDDKQLVQERGQKRQRGEAVPNRYIFRIISKDGNIKWVDLSGATVAIGESTAGIISVLDITERKQAEEELRTYHEHLEDMVKERTVKLEASIKELEAFSYSVSHDLRAPLRSIYGFSQVLLEEYDSKLDSQGKNYLARVMRATQRMTAIIEDLLKLSKITRAEINIAEINLSEIAQSVIDELRKSEPERNINIKVAGGLQDKADARLMRIALENLLGNAWKFTSKQPDALIEFGSIKKDNATVYFIRDNGAGFNMSYVDKLFIPFQRLHTDDEYPGTGIGLATVRRIIFRHGGKVWAEAQAGKGATFYFTLQ